MITQLLKRRIFADSLLSQLFQYALFLITTVILVGGFRLIAELDLTKAQLALSYSIILALVLQGMTLCVLVELVRKLTNKAAATTA